MKNSENTARTCPICGGEYHGAPALSRTDNSTMICPDCGTRQSLENMNLPPEEIEKIISIIHRNCSE